MSVQSVILDVLINNLLEYKSLNYYHKKYTWMSITMVWQSIITFW